MCRVYGDYVPATTNIAIGPLDSPGEIYDSCESCAGRVKDMLNTKPERRKPGRPPANAEKT